MDAQAETTGVIQECQANAGRIHVEAFYVSQ
jgi:hypothetical protein